jgi:hypothetical protein
MRKRTYNPKRRLGSDMEPSQRKSLAKRAIYVGSQFHKRHLRDWNLEPPSKPRLNRPLCDALDLNRRGAQQLLERGIELDLISPLFRGDFPQIVWAVTENDTALEAQLDNEQHGTYHGYPMGEGDPLADEVVRVWKEKSAK